MPNLNPQPERTAMTARVIEDHQLLMHRLVNHHLPEFMEVAVTMSQAKVLYAVLAAGSLRLTELAARLGVSLSTTSGQVDRLVEHGLLDRRDDPADRRQVVISVTAAGESLLDRFRELNNEQLLLLLERIDDDDLALVERAMAILAAAADLSGGPGRVPGPSSTDRKDDIA